MPSQTYTARWVFPVDRPPIPWGRLTVAHGRIVAIQWPDDQSHFDVDLGNVALLPGLVNAHTHLDLGELRGQLPPPADFTSWLREVVRYRRTSSPEAWLEAIKEGVAESLRSGTTLLGDITYGGLSGEPLQVAALRSSVFFEVLGLTAEKCGTLVDSATLFEEQNQISTTRLGWSPHAPYSVGRRLLRSCLMDALSYRRPVAMHFAESHEELELMSKLTGPLRQFLQDVGAWNPEELHSSLLEIALALGDHQPVLYVHANYLFEMPDHDAVLDQLARGTASVVYCPRTHAYFGHPPHPFMRLLQQGYNVALGTDSLASNPDLSILNEMRHLWPKHRQELSGADLLRMGTLNGAKAMGWGNEVGSLSPGKCADLVAIELTERADEPHEALFDGGGVTGLWISGVLHQPEA